MTRRRLRARRWAKAVRPGSKLRRMELSNLYLLCDMAGMVLTFRFREGK